jgi:hypothetical protein
MREKRENSKPFTESIASLRHSVVEPKKREKRDVREKDKAFMESLGH